MDHQAPLNKESSLPQIASDIGCNAADLSSGAAHHVPSEHVPVTSTAHAMATAQESTAESSGYATSSSSSSGNNGSITTPANPSKNFAVPTTPVTSAVPSATFRTGTEASASSTKVTLQQLPSSTDGHSTEQQLRAQITSLNFELQREKQRREAAERTIIDLKAESARTAMQLEEEEENITNKLMKRLSELKLEKERLARQSESEEEFLTNTLQLRLEELQRQKHTIIASAEAEQEYIVNKLQRQLDELKVEKSALERRVQSLSRSNTPAGGVTPTSSPATSMRSSEGLLSRGGSLSLPPSGP